MRRFLSRVTLLVVLASGGLLVAGCVFFVAIEQRAGVPIALDFTDISGTGRYEAINLGSGYVTQVKHPDRYLGYDYITSQNVPIKEEGSTKASALPEWPGRYVFQRAYLDNAAGEVRSEQRFTTVHPTAQLFEIRGASIGINSPVPVNMEGLDATLDELKEDGFNWVRYEPYFTFDGSRPTRVFLCDEQTQAYSPNCQLHPTPLELQQATQLARSKGFRVAWHLNGNSYDPSGWMGRYELWSIEPPDLQAFFSSYADVLVAYAALAEQSGVEILSLSEFSWPLWKVGRTPYEDLIHRVRSVYHGRITATEFTSPGIFGASENEYPVTDLLDFIGMMWGFNAGQGGAPGPMGYTNGDCNPSVETMETNLFDLTDRYIVPYAKRYGKEIIVTSLPFLDHDCFNWKMSQDAGDYSTGRDEQEGVDVIEASMRVIAKQGMQGFFVGIYFQNGGEPDPRYGPMGMLCASGSARNRADGAPRLFCTRCKL